MAAADEKNGFTVIWEIENLKCLTNEAAFIRGPCFVLKSLRQSKWRLLLIVYEDYLSAYLKRAETDNGPESIQIDYEVSILPIYDLEDLLKEKGNYKFENGNERLISCAHYENFKWQGKDFDIGDTLNIRCQIWSLDMSLREPEISFGKTQVKEEKGSFVWIIKDFDSILSGVKNKILLQAISKEFPLLTLKLSLAISNDAGNKYVGIRLSLDQPDEICLTFIFKVYRLDATGTAVTTYKKVCYFRRDNSEYIKLGSIENFIENKKHKFPNNILNLKCEWMAFICINSNDHVKYGQLSVKNVHDIETDVNNYNMNSEGQSDSLSHTLKDGLNAAYKEQVLCDLKLQAGGKTFHVHKLVLSVRSPVFKAMFTNDMKEKSSHTVDIPNMDADTMGHMLNYLYSDSLDNLQWNSMVRLFSAADEYEILPLMNACSCYLEANLSVSNACEVLVLADMHNDVGLKAGVQEYFVTKCNEIISSADWKKLLQDNVTLAAETLQMTLMKK